MGHLGDADGRFRFDLSTVADTDTVRTPGHELAHIRECELRQLVDHAVLRHVRPRCARRDRVSASLAQNSISILDLAGSYAELGARVLEHVAAQFTQYGLEITQLVVENVSLPAEVEAAIDARAKLGAIGNLDDYARLQGADALRDAARNPGGGASAGVGIGLGAALAQSLVAPQRPTSQPTEPPPIPQAAWYYVVENERRGPTDLAGLKSGGVGRDTLVWKSGMAGWVAASGLPEVMRAIG